MWCHWAPGFSLHDIEQSQRHGFYERNKPDIAGPQVAQVMPGIVPPHQRPCFWQFRHLAEVLRATFGRDAAGRLFEFAGLRRPRQFIGITGTGSRLKPCLLPDKLTGGLATTMGFPVAPLIVQRYAIAQTAQPCPPRGVIVVDFIDTAENRKVLAAKRQHFRHERQSIQTAIRVECRGNLGEWSHAYPFARPETKGRRGRLEAQYLTSKA